MAEAIAPRRVLVRGAIGPTLATKARAPYPEREEHVPARAPARGIRFPRRDLASLGPFQARGIVLERAIVPALAIAPAVGPARATSTISSAFNVPRLAPATSVAEAKMVTVPDDPVAKVASIAPTDQRHSPA